MGGWEVGGGVRTDGLTHPAGAPFFCLQGPKRKINSLPKEISLFRFPEWFTKHQSLNSY